MREASPIGLCKFDRPLQIRPNWLPIGRQPATEPRSKWLLGRYLQAVELPNERHSRVYWRTVLICVWSNFIETQDGGLRVCDVAQILGFSVQQIFLAVRYLQFEKTTLERDRHSVSAIAGSKLFENILDMVLNGMFRNT